MKNVNNVHICLVSKDCLALRSDPGYECNKDVNSVAVEPTPVKSDSNRERPPEMAESPQIEVEICGL